MNCTENCKYNIGGSCVTFDQGNLCPFRKEDDAVKHPSHYTQGGIECIEAIKASMSKEAFSGYCKGNIMKYLWRYKHKSGVEDLKKANQYLKWLEEAEGEKSKSEA